MPITLIILLIARRHLCTNVTSGYLGFILARDNMKSLRLALIGFGTVGQGLAEILRTDAEKLATQNGFAATIVAVSDLLKGSVYHPDGLDIGKLLDAARGGKLWAYHDQPGLERGLD